MAKILVTGGAGFIGSHLVERLVALGHRVVVIDNLSSGTRKNLGKTKISFYRMDIRSRNIAAIFKKEKPSILFHFAAKANVRQSIKDPMTDAWDNIVGSLNVIQAFKDFSPKPGAVIFSSSGGAIYGEAKVIPTPEKYSAEPVSPYGIAKLSFEKYLNFFGQIRGLPFTILRFANVYGPRQNAGGEGGVIAIFSNQAITGETMRIYGNGLQTRDFVFVEDVVDAALLAIRSQKNGIFNVGTGKETSINELLAVFAQVAASRGLVIKKKNVPSVAGEIFRSVLDYSKIKRELGWLPATPLITGLEKTLDYFLTNRRR